MKWVLNNIFTTWEKSPSHLERSGDLVPPNGDWFFIYLFCPWFIPSPRSDPEDALGLTWPLRFLPHFQSGRRFPAHGRGVGNWWSLMSFLTQTIQGFWDFLLAWRCQEARGDSPQLLRLETGIKAAWGHVTFTSPKLGWFCPRHWGACSEEEEFSL